MRRVSMAVLKSTARHSLRGLDIITPQAMHTHTARRAKSEAAREADYDEHRCTAGTCGPSDATATTAVRVRRSARRAP